MADNPTDDVGPLGTRVSLAIARHADAYTPSFGVDDVLAQAARQTADVETTETTAIHPGRRASLGRAAAAVVLVAAGVGAITVSTTAGDADVNTSMGRAVTSPTTPVEPGSGLEMIDTTPPDELAVLEHPPEGEQPLRDDPFLDWLSGELPTETTRRFAVADESGHPTSVVTVRESSEPDFAEPMANAPAAPVEGVDARVVDGSIVWATPDGFVSVDGDLPPDALAEWAGQIVAAGSVADAPAPDGYAATPEPVEIGNVFYRGDKTMSIRLFEVPPGTDAPGPDPLPPAFSSAVWVETAEPIEGGGWVGPIDLSNGEGGLDGSWAWVNVGDDRWAEIRSPFIELDPATVATEIELVDGSTVSPVPFGESWTFGFPPEYRITAAVELTIGRALVVTYTQSDRSCTAVVTQYEPRGFGSSRGCATDDRPASDCLTFSDPSLDEDVFLAWTAAGDDLAVRINGTPTDSPTAEAGPLTIVSGRSATSVESVSAMTPGGFDACDS